MSSRVLLRDGVLAAALALSSLAPGASTATGSEPAGVEHDFGFEFGT